MKVIDARFLISCERFNQSPELDFSEVAFLGRSNVGKSSLINALANHKGLAKSSSTPGKTQLINFFEITFEDKNKLVLIDLPGFGYARVSKDKKAAWNKNLSEFLHKRKSIKCFIHLIDSRHDDLEIDNNVYEYLKTFLSEEQVYLKVYTKIDKLNQSEFSKLKARQKDAIYLSSTSKKGIDKLQAKLYEYIK